jgi:adenine deaminase
MAVAVSDTERDILKLAVCERHHATGNIAWVLCMALN